MDHVSASPDTLDRILIRLAWLGPVVLVVLQRWQMSLDQWYVPLTSQDFARMSEAITEEAKPWLETLDDAGGRRLFLVTDPDCPCSLPAIQRVKAAMNKAQSTFPTPITLTIVHIGDRDATNNAAWSRIVQNIPATPSLIVVDGKRLRYVGPAVSGSLCIGDSSVTGLLDIRETSDGPAVNYIDEGCFCAIPRRLNAGSDAGQDTRRGAGLDIRPDKADVHLS